MLFRSRLRDGGRHALVVVDGFLSQGGRGVEDWTQHKDSVFQDSTWFHIDWAAGKLIQIGLALFNQDILFFNKAAARAEEAGSMLAQLISQTEGWTYTLAGHSLGAAVVTHALRKLRPEHAGRVQDAYLLGAALHLPKEEWIREIGRAHV